MIQNTGDKPLNITALAIGGDANDGPAAADFSIAGQNCTAAPVAPGVLATPTTGRGAARDLHGAGRASGRCAPA